MSSQARATASDAAEIKALLDAALPRINADLQQFGDVFKQFKWSVSAISRIQGRISGLRRSLQAAAPHPAIGPAVSGLTSLSQGVKAFDEARRSTNEDESIRLHDAARALFDRSSTELLAADRALGCPYGCRKSKRLS